MESWSIAGRRPRRRSGKHESFQRPVVMTCISLLLKDGITPRRSLVNFRAHPRFASYSENSSRPVGWFLIHVATNSIWVLNHTAVVSKPAALRPRQRECARTPTSPIDFNLSTKKSVLETAHIDNSSSNRHSREQGEDGITHPQDRCRSDD